MRRTKAEALRAAGRVWGVREVVSRVQGAPRRPREGVGPHADGQRRCGRVQVRASPILPTHPFPAGARPLRVVGEAGRRLWGRPPSSSPLGAPTPTLGGGETRRHEAF